jgi:arsenite-transporting ATPase
MSSMLGGGAQEDMFAKLDSMRAIITEVNTQFKDPVRSRPHGHAGLHFVDSC